jgi:hypothetical protein
MIDMARDMWGYIRCVMGWGLLLVYGFEFGHGVRVEIAS